MIVWTGWGFLTIVIFLAFGVPIQFYVESKFGEDYYKTHGWPGLVACLGAASLIWPIGRWLNREEIGPPANEFEEPNSARYRQTGRHTFFFVPMEYWAFVVLMLGMYYIINKPGF